MIDSVLQFIFGTISTLNHAGDIPVASAEIIEGNWSAKSAFEIEETADSYLGKDALLSLTDESLYWVVAVLDGDTILVSGSDRELFQVRLLAVDTHEINGPDSTAECYGVEAAEFTMDFLSNRAVRLTADPTNEDEDPYGRKLRYVDVLQEDGTFDRLNDALLSEGYATFPRQYAVSNPTHFEDLEKSAQTESKGLWGACQ